MDPAQTTTRRLERSPQAGLNAQVEPLPPDTQEPTEEFDETITFLQPPDRAGDLGRLGRYRILRVLGKGGMGTVFLGEDIYLSRPVALKTPRTPWIHDPAAHDRFLHEARAAATVQHDHVVTILHVSMEDGVPVISMPYLKGETLADRLRRCEKLPLDRALCIGEQVAAGLAAAHEFGLIHGDIKPANIWLEAESDRVKIMDFGLARAMGNVRAPTEIIGGTFSYMAPEQASSEPVDARVDIYSLGVTLFRMCTGGLPSPFRGDPASSSTLFPPTSTALPSLLERFLFKLMSAAPEDRPGNATEVCMQLSALRRDIASAETGDSPIVPARKRVRKARLIPAVLALFLVSGLVTFLLTRSKQEPSDPTIPPSLMSSHSEADAKPVILSDDRVLLFNAKQMKFEPHADGARLTMKRKGVSPALIKETRSLDFCADVKVKILSASSPARIGLVFRTERQANGHLSQYGLAYFSPQERKAYLACWQGKWVGGLLEFPVDEALADTSHFHFKLQAKGSQVRCWINSKQVFEVNAFPLEQPGMIGLYVSAKADGPVTVNFRDLRWAPAQP